MLSFASSSLVRRYNHSGFRPELCFFITAVTASSTRAMGYMGTLNSKRQEWYGEVMTPLELSASLLSRTLTLITGKSVA